MAYIKFKNVFIRSNIFQFVLLWMLYILVSEEGWQLISCCYNRIKHFNNWVVLYTASNGELDVSLIESGDFLI